MSEFSFLWVGKEDGPATSLALLTNDDVTYPVGADWIVQQAVDSDVFISPPPQDPWVPWVPRPDICHEYHESFSWKKKSCGEISAFLYDNCGEI